MRKNRFCAPVVSFVVFAILLSCSRYPVSHSVEQSQSWPDSIPWWKRNNLRVIQTNLPAYEGGLNPDSLVADLVRFSANTLIINAGGIMAFYPTELEGQYVNPHMDKNMLGRVIEKCHAKGIRVITRFDFSRAHESIFKAHPDWFYLSPKGERMINENMYVVSIDAPYEQQVMFDIVNEVITKYPIDGIFLNMPGYQTRNPYLNLYQGIDQNEHGKRRFSEFSGGMTLPLEENTNDPVFRMYEKFKKHSVDGLMERLHKLVKSRNPKIAICTYVDKYVDIIRHESQTNALPYWPYNASDNVSNARNSFPDHIISNASIQQISFQSRYNAVEPEEVFIRLYENIANGSGLDLSLMGDFQDYEDERNYRVIEDVYRHHEKHEVFFGNYTSAAKVAVIAPGAWPSGEAAQEYRGVQLMLKEAHIQYDIFEDSQFANLEATLKNYRLIILPEITRLSEESVAALTRVASTGVNIIATNRTLADSPDALMNLFGVRMVTRDNDGAGHYLSVDNEGVFKRLKGQKLLFWKFNLGLGAFDQAEEKLLPIYTPGIPGPPEIIGGHKPTGYHAVAIKHHGAGRAALLPVNLGKLYFLHGYEQHKNILLDLIDHICPTANDVLTTDAPPRIEVILQHFRKNTPENYRSERTDGMILHLVNLTGFSGNTYFEPIPVRGLRFTIRTGFKPSRVYGTRTEANIQFDYANEGVSFVVDELRDFEGIVIAK